MTTVARRVAGLALLAALTSCASEQALRMALDERDAELRDLKQELTTIQGELVRLRGERDGLQVALEDAALRMQEAPATPAPAYPDLDREGIGVGMRGSHIVFTVPSAVTFASGKADLTAKGKQALDVLAKRLKEDFEAQEVFYVEGHTDSDPIQRSGFESNRDLSLQRAKAVHAYLVERARIPDGRFVIVGHGQYRPVAANDTPENKARNRRVEIVVHASD